MEYVSHVHKYDGYAYFEREKHKIGCLVLVIILVLIILVLILKYGNVDRQFLIFKK